MLNSLSKSINLTSFSHDQQVAFVEKANSLSIVVLFERFTLSVYFTGLMAQKFNIG